MGIEPIAGRYLTVTIQGVPRRIYFEEAGQGRSVLCLHTAGADTRQWRHLMNDTGVTDTHRLIAFEFPDTENPCRPKSSRRRTIC